MKTIMKCINKLHILPCLFAVLVLVGACKKAVYTTLTTDDVNITGYLEKSPETFSLMSEIIERSGSYGYLGAYGTYTLFSPTNDAVNEWLKSINKSAVADVPVEDLKKFVNYHVIKDTLSTKNFADGKLGSLTLYGQYITSTVLTVNGIATYTLNKNARVIQSNIRVGNGIIQVIDHVLLPKTQTLAQLITSSSRYSVFKQALVETGFYDSINVDPFTTTDPQKKFQTVIAESDSALAAAGFNTYAALKSKLSTKGNPKDHADSLWLYVAYHITPSANYLADIVSVSALNTLAPLEIITTKYAGSKVLLNEVEFNGKTEPGVEINRIFSDQPASNGVLHDVKTNFRIKVRTPTPLYWDMELDGLSQNPRHPNYGLKIIDLYANGASFNPASYRVEAYKATTQYTVGLAQTKPVNKNDFINVSISAPGTNLGRPLWHDFRTPLLVKGTYKVWICFAQGNAATTQIIMNPGTPDEKVLPNIINMGSTLTASSGVNLTAANSDNLLEAAGYKRYMALTTDAAINAQGVAEKGEVLQATATSEARLAGIVNITKTDRQWIRMAGTGTTNGTNIVLLDMIHFIPVDMDQQYPRFSRTGTIFKRP